MKKAWNRAAEKEASRRKDLADLAAGRITREELIEKNSFFGALDLSQARIVNAPDDKL